MPTERPAASPDSQEAAQRRANRIAAFRGELDTLEREGVLTLEPEARARLGAYHDGLLDSLARRFDVDRDESERRMSLGMQLASLIGAVALSAAVFFFFYRFWGALSLTAQVVILTIAPMAMLAGVHVAARRERTLYVASLFAIVAAACFGLDLGVIGGQFNLAPTPSAIGSWGLFALLVAYAYGFRLLLAGSLVAIVAFLGAWIAALAGLDWTVVLVRPEPTILCGIALIAAAERRPQLARTGFPVVFRLIGTLAVLLPLLLPQGWPELSYLPWSGPTVKTIYTVLGFLLAAAGLWLGFRQRWTETVNASAAFVVVFIYVKCIQWTWDWLPRYLFFLLLAAIALAMLFLLRRLRAHMRQV